MRRVLICGASIAGPALAFWLNRYGFEVTVVERAPGLRPGGQAIDLRGVARQVVARMGLDAAVRAASVKTAGFTVVADDGTPLSSSRAEDHGGDGQIAEIEILRGDLSRVFYDATREDAEYVFADHIARLVDRGDAVSVELAGGGRREVDVVIGADGLHSGTRALLFGREAPPLRHLGTYVAFWTLANHLGLQDWALAYEEEGRSAGIRPVRGNREAIAYLAFQGKIDFDHRDIPQQKGLVRAHAAGMGWEVPRLVAAMDDAPDFYFDSCSQVVLDSWSRGRVGLLGDAAFSPSPLTGQGTSLAVVGAYVLAGELATAGDDLPAALKSYEHRLRDWVTATQNLAHDHTDATALRDVANAYEPPNYTT